MKKILLLTVIILAALAVLAHEFWLEPKKFIYKKGETANITFRVGENFTGENWNGNRQKIKSLDFFSNGSKTDMSSAIGDAKGDSLQLTFMQEGTAMIAYNGHNSFIQLEPGKFNAYLKEDGLTEIIEYRKKNDQWDSTGKEFYQRSVKTILQIGKKLTQDYRKPTTLPLDITPNINPYSISDSAGISCKLLFKGKPLTSHLCKIWNHYNGKTIMQEKLSDSKGEIRFMVHAKGRWMVSAVKMISSEDPAAQWQSYWGSATWGYY